MQSKTIPAGGGEALLDLGELTPKQKQFCESRSKYTAYGGARGGGKSYVCRTKAILGALNYPGIRILFVRRDFQDLEQTIILPMRQVLPAQLAVYVKLARTLVFCNGSTIKFCQYGPEDDDPDWEGQKYDWIFVDEAAQIEEEQFLFLSGHLGGANGIPKRMYLTATIGGVGTQWVKRLFVTRNYREGERAEDYTFIPSLPVDNPYLSPEYVRILDSLPEKLRVMWRDGFLIDDVCVLE